jgi:hypothetical protein
MPRVGPVAAMASAAFAPPVKTFRQGGRSFGPAARANPGRMARSDPALTA